MGPQKEFGASIEAPPDRTDCPPDTRVKAYAKGEISGDSSLEEHVRQCAWCASEYRDHVKDMMWDQFLKRSTYASFIVPVAIVIAVSLRSCR